MSSRRRVSDTIDFERHRQENLRAAGNLRFTCHTPNGLTNPEKMKVLMEKAEEVSCTVLKDGIKDVDLYIELIQVAAVAAAWAESLLDRK